MTPDAKDHCVFAVKRGDMKNRLDINYNLPQYTMLEEKLYQTFGENLKRISDIADVICGPFGSAMSFFANHGYDTEGFTINPYMVVNKVFSSYYKHVQFPIVTFDELKREIQL